MEGCQMIKALCKKSKESKGFTLIELIVVIAILAILALILVPRFGGFTDDAKAEADKAAARTIQTAVVSLMANGTIEVSGGNGTFAIGNGTTLDGNSSNIVILRDVDGVGTKDDKDLEAALQNLLGTGLKHSTGGTFNVVINQTTLDVTVTP
jgi:prepilin-type N-terminal cleavage/methylation domain-containing protein